MSGRRPVVQEVNTCEMSKVFMTAKAGDVLLLRFRDNYSGEELKGRLQGVKRFHDCEWISFEDFSLARMRAVLLSGGWAGFFEYTIIINSLFCHRGNPGTFIAATIGQNLLQDVTRR